MIYDWRFFMKNIMLRLKIPALIVAMSVLIVRGKIDECGPSGCRRPLFNIEQAPTLLFAAMV
jgi:hypothetical protein